MSRLVNILVNHGLLSKDSAIALEAEASRSSNVSIEELAVSRGLASADSVYEALASELGYPFVSDISGDQLDSDIVSSVPMNFCKERKILPLHRTGGRVVVAMARPFDYSALDDLKLIIGCELTPIVTSPMAVMKAIEYWFESQKDMTERVIASLDEERERYAQTRTSHAEDILDTSQAPVIQLVNSFLYEAIKARASDIHIEPYEDKIKVRYRIDGVLFDAPTPPKEFQSLIISRIKIQSRMDIAESRLPQDGSMSIVVGQRRLDIRVSTLPTKFGERIVMRILEKSHTILHLEDLGFGVDNLKAFRNLLLMPHGIFLVTGPTGSGKSTTLYSALLTIATSEKNVITLEDPIENEIKDICQVQVKPEIGLTFAAGLRHILRQDPDVIMVGEIRDFETAEIAVQSSLTGHLVFSTLHTNDSASSITRLADMGIENYLIASTVIGILAQRLVRILCPSCRRPHEISDEVKQDLGSNVSTIFEEEGCDTCRHTGFAGRKGIFELLSVSDTIREAISSGASTYVLKNLALKEGMRTLRDDGLLKVIAGQTSLGEVDRVTGGR